MIWPKRAALQIRRRSVHEKDRHRIRRHRGADRHRPSGRPRPDRLERIQAADRRGGEGRNRRSEERRVGKEGVSTCRSRRTQYPKKYKVDTKIRLIKITTNIRRYTKKTTE